MQGVVKDEDGGYVKAAIVKFYRVEDASFEPEMELITYAKTDENGNFIIKDLDPDEKYTIEIHVEEPVQTKSVKVQFSAEEREEDQNAIEDRFENPDIYQADEYVLHEVYTGHMMSLDKDFEGRLYSSKNTTWC